MSVRKFDVVIIGAGPTGLMAALQAAAIGKRTLVLEKRPGFGDRAADQIRFQAVIVDEQTLINLNNVGVHISQTQFPEIDHANFYSDNNNSPPVIIPYHAMPTQLQGPSNDDLGLLAYRRKIVALSSIASVEQSLYELISTNPLIDCYFDQDIAAIGVAESISVETSAGKMTADYLAIADGASSDRSGALKLLGVSKRRLPHVIDIAISTFADKHRAGELTVKESAQGGHQHTAMFGLSNETVLYQSIPPNSGQTASQPSQLAAQLTQVAADLGVTATMSATPRVIQQQAGMVTDNTIDERIFVLGDAAQSGTAVLGVYFNKGIFDSVAFGRCLRDGDVRRFRLRASSLAARTLLIEEYLIGEAWNKPFAALRSNRLGYHIADALPRSLFRLKAGRHGLARTLALNTADTMASLSRGLEQTLPSEQLRKTSRQSARVWQALQNTLNGSPQ